MTAMPTRMIAALAGAALLAVVAAPVQARTTPYGGIGATVAGFYAAHPHGTGAPPAGTTYYRIDITRGGRVEAFHVLVGRTSKHSAPGLLARLTGPELPADAKLVRPYNGYCAVYRSRWLGKVLFGLPARLFGGRRVHRFGYVIVYAPQRRGWNGAMASLMPVCRG